MFPSKSMLDYMMEINRLFPRENDNIYLQPTTANQFFNQSMARSSSSTDTSPESCPDTIGYRFPPEQTTPRPDNRSEARNNQQLDFSNHYEHPQPQIYETPLVARQRSIVTRRLSENFEHHDIPNAWNNQDRQMFLTDEFIRSPNAQVNQIFYELFPADGERRNESVASSYMSPKPNVSPRSANTSLYESNMSLWTETMSEMSDFSTSPPSVGWSTCSTTSPRALMPSSFREPMYGPSSSLNTTGYRKVCSFCRRNGETPLVYTTHKVKEKMHGKYIVTCPILRSHVCATCGATGDNAHTKSYCPVVCQNNNGRPLRSTTVRLKTTRLKSNGTRRF